jgi:hypothetical protein
MTTLRTHFTFRVDTWTPDGESIMEHVAGVEDYQVALASASSAKIANSPAAVLNSTR